MLLLILSTLGRKWGFCTEIPVKSDWSELSVGILAAPVFVKAIRQGFFSFLCERFNEAADIHFSQSDFISFSSKAAQSKSYHQTFSPSHCNHCHWFVPTFCSLLPALPQTCNHQTVWILTRKKIAQLKNTRENENSSYSSGICTHSASHWRCLRENLQATSLCLGTQRFRLMSWPHFAPR